MQSFEAAFKYNTNSKTKHVPPVIQELLLLTFLMIKTNFKVKSYGLFLKFFDTFFSLITVKDGDLTKKHSPDSLSASKNAIFFFLLFLFLKERTVHFILLLYLGQQKMAAHLKSCHHPLQGITRRTGMNLKI